LYGAALAPLFVGRIPLAGPYGPPVGLQTIRTRHRAFCNPTLPKVRVMRRERATMALMACPISKKSATPAEVAPPEVARSKRKICRPLLGWYQSHSLPGAWLSLVEAPKKTSPWGASR